jgi:hypothetical protein
MKYNELILEQKNLSAVLAVVFLPAKVKLPDAEQKARVPAKAAASTRF